ncbi:MAG: hypothetical protein ABSA17_07390 [Rhabdochlamydiaceae bacterium]
MLYLSLLGAGAALDYYYGSPSRVQSPPNTIERVGTYLAVLEIGKQTISLVNRGMKFGVRTMNVVDLSFSPKFVESSIFLIGSIGIAWWKYKPAAGNYSSQAAAVGKSLLAGSKTILSWFHMMKGLSRLAKNEDPPVMELAVAVAMIAGSRLGSGLKGHQ